MQLKPEPGETETNLVDSAGAQRFCVGDIRDLGTAGVFTTKPRQQRVGNVLVVLVEKVVGGKESEARIEVDTSAGLVIRQPLGKAVRSEVSVSAIGGVRRGDVSRRFFDGTVITLAGICAPGKTQLAELQPAK